jgi:serine/threonine protein kinase
LGKIITRGGGLSELRPCKYNDEDCITKLIQLDCVIDHDKKSMIEEILLIESMRSPYLVKYYGAIITNGYLGYVMKRYDSDLRQRIDILEKYKMKLSFTEMLKCCKEISNGIKYLHENKILHRDLKADNIFIIEDKTKPIKLDIKLDNIKSKSNKMVSIKVYTLYDGKLGEHKLKVKKDITISEFYRQMKTNIMIPITLYKNKVELTDDDTNRLLNMDTINNDKLLVSVKTIYKIRDVVIGAI